MSCDVMWLQVCFSKSSSTVEYVGIFDNLYLLSPIIDNTIINNLSLKTFKRTHCWTVLILFSSLTPEGDTVPRMELLSPELWLLLLENVKDEQPGLHTAPAVLSSCPFPKPWCRADRKCLFFLEDSHPPLAYLFSGTGGTDRTRSCAAPTSNITAKAPPSPEEPVTTLRKSFQGFKE